MQDLPSRSEKCYYLISRSSLSLQGVHLVCSSAMSEEVDLEIQTTNLPGVSLQVLVMHPLRNLFYDRKASRQSQDSQASLPASHSLWDLAFLCVDASLQVHLCLLRLWDDWSMCSTEIYTTKLYCLECYQFAASLTGMLSSVQDSRAAFLLFTTLFLSVLLDATLHTVHR